MKKLLGACFAVGLMLSASACGGKKPAPAAPDNTMNNAGGSDGSGSGSGSGSGDMGGDMKAGNPCGHGGGAPDPCGGGE